MMDPAELMTREIRRSGRGGRLLASSTMFLPGDPPVEVATIVYELAPLHVFPERWMVETRVATYANDDALCSAVLGEVKWIESERRGC